ncbi:RNA-binding domain-containing protein, partial [Ramicandelaber brevisporus]
NTDTTIRVNGLDPRVTEALLYELFLQVGRVEAVSLPIDRLSRQHSGYAFITFETPRDAEYAANVMNLVRLYDTPIRASRSSVTASSAALDGTGGHGTRAAMDVGANLHISGLDYTVDEKLIFDTFSTFGPLLRPPRIPRDNFGNSNGYALISFGDFEVADAAIRAMNGQYLAGKQIKVQYALKNDGSGTRHGSAAERSLA